MWYGRPACLAPFSPPPSLFGALSSDLTPPVRYNGGQLGFTYALKKTPIALTVEPRRLSFALTSNVTITGYNFGLLTRELSVKFGERNCRIWESTKSMIRFGKRWGVSSGDVEKIDRVGGRPQRSQSQ